MSSIPAHLRRLVILRAADRCEYCGLSQTGQEATFRVDHIIPVSESGPTHADNLALACISCSLRKGARLQATDSQTGQSERLFHPRREVWSDHFFWEDVRIVGRTPSGRATVAALDMNRPLVLAIRREEALHGRHPPDSLHAPS
jgi:hypothetical protein